MLLHEHVDPYALTDRQVNYDWLPHRQHDTLHRLIERISAAHNSFYHEHNDERSTNDAEKSSSPLVAPQSHESSYYNGHQDSEEEESANGGSGYDAEGRERGAIARLRRAVPLSPLVGTSSAEEEDERRWEMNMP